MDQPKTKRDPEGTRRRILAAAAEEFAASGLSGARVDQIARRALTNERMLYYYFGSKEQLFTTVLEQAYGAFVDAESSLDLENLPPEEAITRFAHFVWNYYFEHQDLLRLANNENLHEARYLKGSVRMRELRSPILSILERILRRGQQAGVFRDGIDTLDFYVTLSALGYYVLSNRYTIDAMLGRNFADPAMRAPLMTLHTEMVLAYLKK